MTSANNLNVLVIGSGGREHALVRAALTSPAVTHVIAAPGNGGIENEVPTFKINVEDAQAVVQLAQEHQINFAIVGPEVPLALGIADVLRAAGIPTYGPGKDGAKLEASKAYCKDFFARHQIPTARYGNFTDSKSALTFLDACPAPLVVKASGLAAGKGVIICQTRREAEIAIHDMLDDHAFGQSGQEIVIEEFLDGEEASIMVMVSGTDYICLPVSQDHKRAGEGDTGLNTGGMGAYAPASIVSDDLQSLINRTIIEPTLAGLQSEGIDYRGTLYIGLMIGQKGPQVLEFNVRFGDPECQILLPLCQSDPVELMYACATQTLEPQAVDLRNDHAIIVVLAAKGYPGTYPKGDPIEFPAEIPNNVQIIHAGTQRRADGTIVTAGGRVLGVVAFAQSLQQAADDAYAVCDQIKWEGKTLRRDIGWRELARGNHS